MQLLVLFFFLMLFMPQVYQGPRAILLLLVLLTTFKNKMPVHLSKEVIFYWSLSYFVAIYGFVIGLIKGNPGVFPSASFYLVWPILFLYFFIKCNQTSKIETLLKTIIYGGMIVAVFNLLLIVNAFVLHIGLLDSLGEELGCMFNIQDGFAEYFSPSGNHLVYILYFSVSLLFLAPKALGIKKKILYPCIFLCLIDILLSNRRAMWLLLGLLPFMLIIILSMLPYHKKLIVKVGAITVILSFVIGGVLFSFLDIEYVTNELLSSFDFSGENDSNLERILQGKSLWNDFLTSPIFGSGMGYVSNYIRSPRAPWVYELTYNYILAAYGIFGFILYTFSTGWIFIKSIKLSQKSKQYARYLLPQIMGLEALLFMSASNPYIVTFDFVWAIYLPVTTINAIWYERKKSKANISLS